MPRLPVSRAEVLLREPNGGDDMMLHEAAGAPVEIGLALLSRLAGDGDWAALTVTDYEALLLALRTARFGPHLALGFACPLCREPVEITIAVDDFLTDVRPRAVPGVTPDPARPGWYRLAAAGFRLPTAGDQAAVVGMADPERGLAERCLDAVARDGRHRGQVERAMSNMAPEVSRPIAGQCPGCGDAVAAPLHVTRIVVGELCRAAATVHDDVDMIARAYHWPEATILALPQSRRRSYVERIRRAQPQAA